jgi:hypothetical protein
LTGCKAAAYSDGPQPMNPVAALRTRAHLVVIALAVGFILAADIFKRAVRLREATICSMIAWTLLLVAFLQWAWLGRGLRAALRDLARIAVLTLVAGVVLYLYFVRSGSIDAGTHVDAVYSYIGLTWFLDLQNPITFVAPNPSYIQLPLMEFGHLPALLIGFDRLGAFSCLLGTMLQVGILLAVTTILFVPQRLRVQVLIAALAAAVFSNRLLVLMHNNFGYTVPAICLGLMFMVVVDRESIPDPERIFGGLLLVAALHHYSGLTQVVPIALFWLAVRTGGLRRFPAFLARNPLLVAAAVMFLITLAVNPDPFTRRLQDVTVGVGPAPAAAEASNKLLTKVQKNWAYLVHVYPRAFYYQLFVQNPGSWPFLDIPPLGGWIGPLVFGSWILSAWSMRGRRWRYLLYFLGFVVVLLALAVVQHLITDFSDYRNLTPIIALLVSSLLFLFRAPRSGSVLRAVAIGYAVAVAAFNYVDLPNLHGKVHITPDFAHVSQQTMESVSAYVKRGGPHQLGVSRLEVVLDDFFPLKTFYLKALARYGVPIDTIDVKKFCADRNAALETASAATCEAFLLVRHSRRCMARDAPDEDPVRVRGDLYRSVCDRPGARLADRARVSIALDDLPAE